MYQEAMYSNTFLLKKALTFVGTLAILGLAMSLIDTASILTYLEDAGVNVPSGLSKALSTIGTVYGIQHYIIGLLSVTVPGPLIAAALATGAIGL